MRIDDILLSIINLIDNGYIICRTVVQLEQHAPTNMSSLDSKGHYSLTI